MTGNKVLMLCCSESGHSNVYMATVHSLLKQDPSIELHLGSFARLEDTFREAVETHNCSEKKKPVFHPIQGPPIFEVLDRDPDPDRRMLDVARLAPGFWNTPRAIRFFLLKMASSWTAEEYVDIFEQVSRIVGQVSPDVVVIDGLFSPALSAVQHLKKQKAEGEPGFKVAVLSPNSLKDFTCHLEGGNSNWMKWPVHGAALPMPLTWPSVLLNWYFLKRIMYELPRNTEVPAWTEDIKQKLGLPELEVASMMTLVGGGAASMDRVLLSSAPEVDFPNLDLECGPKEYRDKIVCCGPILNSAVSLRESDPELTSWAEQGPVVYINFGTLCRLQEGEVVEMSRALRALLDKGSPNLRILWKLARETKRAPEYGTGPGSAVYEILGKEIAQDRVRIVDWIRTQPASLLESGLVTCAITHGGASSFYEAVLYVASLPLSNHFSHVLRMSDIGS